MKEARGAKQKLDIVKTNIRVFGLWNTARAILAHVVAPQGRDSYDRRYGVSTDGYVEVDESDIEGEHREHASPYQPTHVRVLRNVFASLPIDPAEYVFVDIGCGKGRALLMASELPYKEVVGIELSPSYCETARRNIETFLGKRRCGKVHVICGDVTAFEPPEENLVLYLFNPFRRPLLRELLANVRKSVAEHPRDVLLAYLNPTAGTEPLVEAGFRCLLDVRVIQPWWSWSLWRLEGAAQGQKVI